MALECGAITAFNLTAASKACTDGAFSIIPLLVNFESAFSAIWRSGWRQRGMIYFTVTFSPEGLHNSRYFRGSVTAPPDI